MAPATRLAGTAGPQVCCPPSPELSRSITFSTASGRSTSVVIHHLPVPGLGIDPGDTNAYRLRTGYAFTADETEAEIVSPPVAVAPGFASMLATASLRGYEQVRAVVPPEYDLKGASTHISVSLPGLDLDRATLLYARAFPRR